MNRQIGQFIPVFTGQDNHKKMRFRFGDGEELAFVGGIFPLLSEENCSSPTSVDATTKIEFNGVTPCLRRQRKRKIVRLRHEINTLGIEVARLRADLGKKYATTSQWETIAMMQLQRRQRAEHNNQVLRRMLTAQHLLAKSILNGRVDQLRTTARMRRSLNSPSFAC